MTWIVLRKLVLPEQLIHLELKISYHIKGTTPFRVECKVVSGQVLCQQVKFPHMIWVSHRVPTLVWGAPPDPPPRF